MFTYSCSNDTDHVTSCVCFRVLKEKILKNRQDEEERLNNDTHTQLQQLRYTPTISTSAHSLRHRHSLSTVCMSCVCTGLRMR